MKTTSDPHASNSKCTSQGVYLARQLLGDLFPHFKFVCSLDHSLMFGYFPGYCFFALLLPQLKSLVSISNPKLLLG